jgi:putative RecB family exonuclease
MPHQITNEAPALPHVSHTRLSTWLDCPKKYEYSYVLEAEEDGTSVPLVFGSAIHEAVAAFFEGLKAKAPLILDEVHAVFERAFADEVYVAETMGCPMEWDDTNFEETVEKGQKMLACFFDKVDRDLDVMHTEYAFDVKTPEGCVLKGFMDCVVRTGENSFKIIELKTAKRTYTQDRLLYDLQPTVYIAALREIVPEADKIEFEYWLLMKTKEPDLKILPVVRNAGDLQELKDTIRGYLLGISTGAFPRRRGWLCDYCGYAKACRASSEQSESQQTCS